MMLTFVLGLVYAPLVRISTKRTKALHRLTEQMRKLAEELYLQANEDKARSSESDSKLLSIVGALSKSEDGYNKHV
jgi:hypothetical protein